MGDITETPEMQSQQFSFPPEPTKNLNWSNLGVGIAREVNGYIQSTWKADTQEWSEPRFVKGSTLELNGLSSALNYGMQAYEGMKGMGTSFHILAYQGAVLEVTQKLISMQTFLAIRDSSGQIRLFRPDQHAARFRHSCDCVSIPPITDEHFTRCISLAVSLNAEFVPPNGAPAMLYVRPLALGTGAQVNIIPPTEFTFCVFVLPSAALLGVSAPVAALVLDEFDRAAPRGTGSAKVGGNYAPVMRWQRSAKEEGYAITLHLDSQTRSLIEEFSAAGFIGVYKGPNSGYKLVVPDSQSVIKSVTSDTCLELARDMGWEVEVRPVKYEELSKFDEVLAVGTAALVVPIKSITRKTPSETFVYDCGADGNTCFKVLFDKVLEAQTGRYTGETSWSVVVKEPSSYGITRL